ncbi:transporter substrate-binding domain-containing protein [Acetobacterium malicum]|uniref:Transporter substrate-binding domain-containing protein n=1 Tax=Acetobacterium malicum TaxID=52692 RepID=A0ABR6YUR8_9FIRM|nr:transporter substrate-binding domain-containing protein [Acetobacterium malicum]
MKSINRIIVMIVITLFCLPAMLAAAQGAPTPEKPVLIIGDDINYPPYSFLDTSGRPAGFNIDLARAVLQRWAMISSSALMNGTKPGPHWKPVRLMLLPECSIRPSVRKPMRLPPDTVLPMAISLPATISRSIRLKR